MLAAVVDAGIRRAHPDGLVFTKAEFEAVRDTVSATVVDTMFTAVSEVAAVLTAQRAADKALKQANAMALLPALSDMLQQSERLVFPASSASPASTASGASACTCRASTPACRSSCRTPAVTPAGCARCPSRRTATTDAGGTFPPSVGAHTELVHARWMLEEFRLSLFAQELGTAETVSLQRITKALAAAR